jgi:hypothetical protein
MTISHTIDGKHVVYTRNWFTGRASLTIDGLRVTLQSPWNPDTHASATLIRQCVYFVGDRALLIEKIRPLFFAGFRPHTYRLYLDGQLLAEYHSR